MADYPEWVVKHKKKGTYINYSKGKYYLYAAHSERIKGTGKVKLIYDGYLGQITEEDGLITPKDKVSTDIIVYEYGISTVILNVCTKIHVSFRKTFKAKGDVVMVAAILSVIHGSYDQYLFEHSYLSIKFNEVSFKYKPTQQQQAAIERGILMINDTLNKYFKDDLPEIMRVFSNVYKVNVNDKMYTSVLGDKVIEMKNKYNINMED